MAKTLLFIYLYLNCCTSLKILQIVPGFTNSHILFNYRLADSLVSLGHTVDMWTQMEMNMVLTSVAEPPKGVSEVRIPILFSDSMKAEGLKVFQTMMFNEGGAYDLWWTGQEFKSMRLEACEQMLNSSDKITNKFPNGYFDLVVTHFHDICPLALAKKIGIDRVIWVTHGTSVFTFAATQMGLRNFASFVPHPLSIFSDTMTFGERIINTLWYISTLDFVNLPQILLSDENYMYRNMIDSGEADLWDLSRNVRVLFINGEQLLDFPRPFPIGIRFMGQIGVRKQKKASVLNNDIKELVDRSEKGFIVFSLGTVSNTSNMPDSMLNSFIEAFRGFPEYTILWRLEMEVSQLRALPNVYTFRWLPQKDLMRHPKMRLLIAHGGYNSFLETSKAGVPAVLMPLFADQFINARRAQRYGIATILDKLNLSSNAVETAMATVLNDPRYTKRAKHLAEILSDQPYSDDLQRLTYGIKLAMAPRNYFTLYAAQRLNIFQHYGIDILALFVVIIALVYQ
ncbi:hypothetical protein AB6A40_003386 [Gnathostoma spinigerum]|uniref:glucuronosyltransferase n=1 Tax=Gnathostoma spinigerum TaxID=75299 RepID=A0ABD6EBP2_9BILA